MWPYTMSVWGVIKLPDQNPELALLVLPRSEDGQLGDDQLGDDHRQFLLIVLSIQKSQTKYEKEALDPKFDP